MLEMKYDTLWELFEKIRIDKKENNTPVYSLDDPKRLLIGWECGNNYHYITLMALRSEQMLKIPDSYKEMYDLINKLIKTSEGRIQIAKLLNCDSFERMINLKSFW